MSNQDPHNEAGQFYVDEICGAGQTLTMIKEEVGHLLD